MFNPSIQNPQRISLLSLYKTSTLNEVKYNTSSEKIPVNQSYNQIDYCTIRPYTNENQMSNSQRCLNNFNSFNINPIEEEQQVVNHKMSSTNTLFDIQQYYSIDPKYSTKYYTEQQINPIFENRRIEDKQMKNVKIDNTEKRVYKQTEDIPMKLESFKSKEGFNNETIDDTDQFYHSLLRSYSIAICDYLNKNPKYSYWKKNWQILERNIKKTDLNIARLNENDKDVAYTENKGEIIKFRWRDQLKYLPRSVFCYVLLHELTHQVFPPSFIGHKSPFPEMLCIICVAGYELRLFDLKNVPKETVKSNGQIITNRNSLGNEILTGIVLLREQNPGSQKYYDNLEEIVLKDLKAN